MKTTPELRELTRRVQSADAALTALSNYRHDGRTLPGADRVLDKALAEVIEAGELARRIREPMKTFRRVRLTGELVRHGHEAFAQARAFKKHGPRDLAAGAMNTALRIAAAAGRQADLALASLDTPKVAGATAVTPGDSDATAMPMRSNADGSEPMPTE